MGYKAENDKAKKQAKVLKWVALCILLVCFLAVCIFSAFVPPHTWKYQVGQPDVKKRKEGEMRLHFLSVGQGDATFVEFPDGSNLLIDGGDGSSQATKGILRYLYALEVSKISHLVVTHTDSDHCGGLDSVLQEFKVLNAYLPPSFESTDTEYAEFYAALLKTDCKRQYSSRALRQLGKEGEEGYSFSFLSPHSLLVEEILEGTQEVEDTNLLSAVVWLEYQGVSTLLMGDCTAAVEESLLQEYAVGAFVSRGVDLSSTEILKIAHHGSKQATSTAFLSALGVKEGIISCGEGNTYGHPHQETLNRLDLAGVNVYRTDLDGHICVTIDKDGEYSVEKIPL